jgi:hypothetical protein
MTDDRYGKIHTDGSRSGGQPLNDSIEAKALALVNEVLAERGVLYYELEYVSAFHTQEALCRAIEQHEAFRQEVSDAVVEYKADQPYVWKQSVSDYFCRFIISKPKPDPLVEVLDEITWTGAYTTPFAVRIRAALEARGLEIREKGR